jgi:hypothetical protein
MNTRNKIGTLLGGAAIAATAIGLTAGLAPASAAPAQSGAVLAIVQDHAHQNNYRLAITGIIRMEQADAVGFLNNLNNGQCGKYGGMYYSIWADDGNVVQIHYAGFPGVQNDAGGYLKATSEGLVYRREITLRKNRLNEDTDGVDEIFAEANFLDSDCKSRRQTSQVISQYF